MENKIYLALFTCHVKFAQDDFIIFGDPFGCRHILPIWLVQELGVYLFSFCAIWYFYFDIYIFFNYQRKLKIASFFQKGLFFWIFLCHHLTKDVKSVIKVNSSVLDKNVKLLYVNFARF